MSGRTSVEVMAVDVLTETVIARPCAEVAAYAGDPTNAPHWYANIVSVRWRTSPPLAVGSKVDFAGAFSLVAPGVVVVVPTELTAAK